MKYSQMSEAQQAAYRDILSTIVSVKSQEEQKYTHEGYRLLVLGNGAGIAILAAFMGSLAGTGNEFGPLLMPLKYFFVGTILAALTYVPLIAVANQATVKVTDQISDFFLDKLDIEKIRGYGFSRAGRVILALLLLGSFLSFCIGVYKCVSILSATT